MRRAAQVPLLAPGEGRDVSRSWSRSLTGCLYKIIIECEEMGGIISFDTYYEEMGGSSTSSRSSNIRAARAAAQLQKEGSRGRGDSAAARRTQDWGVRAATPRPLAARAFELPGRFP